MGNDEWLVRNSIILRESIRLFDIDMHYVLSGAVLCLNDAG